MVMETFSKVLSTLEYSNRMLCLAALNWKSRTGLNGFQIAISGLFDDFIKYTFKVGMELLFSLII